MSSIVLQLLASDNYIPVNRELVKLIGLEETVILGELATEQSYWERENKLVDGMFYCTANKLEERTGLTEYQQRKAIKNLINLGVLIQKLKGVPATRYFYIDIDKLGDIFQTRSEEIKELDPKKLQSSNSNIINSKTKNNKSISKDIDRSFNFGKSKQPQQNLYSRCEYHIKQFSKDPDVIEYLLDFLASMSQMGKLRSEKQFVSILNKLGEMAQDRNKQMTIISYSLEKGYATFYDCTKDTRPGSQRKAPSTDIGYSTPQADKTNMEENIKNGRYEKF